MSGHTPGPWIVDITSAPSIWIMALQPAWRSHPAGVRPIPCDMRQECGEANARLISAAPIGYDMAEAILSWWEAHQHDTYPCGDGDERNTYDEDPEFVDLAKKFIAKAKGQS